MNDASGVQQTFRVEEATIDDLHRAIKADETTVVDVVKAYIEWVRAFNPYDLYTKSHEKPNVEKLKPFYMDLIEEYLPGKLSW